MALPTRSCSRRTERSGITQDHQLVVHNADFHGLPHIVAAVINGIHHGFFNGDVRNILDAGGLGAPLDFIGHDDSVVVRLDGVVSEVENLLLNGVDAAGVKPLGGKTG